MYETLIGDNTVKLTSSISLTCKNFNLKLLFTSFSKLVTKGQFLNGCVIGHKMKDCRFYNNLVKSSRVFLILVLVFRYSSITPLITVNASGVSRTKEIGSNRDYLWQREFDCLRYFWSKI